MNNNWQYEILQINFLSIGYTGDTNQEEPY